MEIHMKPACNQDRVYRELLPELKGDSMPGRGSASWFKEGSWAGVFTGLGDASVFPRHVILRAARSPELTHSPSAHDTSVCAQCGGLHRRCSCFGTGLAQRGGIAHSCHLRKVMYRSHWTILGMHAGWGSPHQEVFWG